MSAVSAAGAGLRWYADHEAWDGSLPAALMLAGAEARQAHALLQGLAARALGLRPEAVSLSFGPDRAPQVVFPPGSGLFLSLARRGPFAALGIARAPIGVDVEVVDAAAEPPWQVLHPDESRGLRACPAAERPARFARLWALKEAYVKALGTGFRRAPESFRVDLRDEPRGAVFDPEGGRPVAQAATAWSGDGGAAFACVLLA